MHDEFVAEAAALRGQGGEEEDAREAKEAEKCDEEDGDCECHSPPQPQLPRVMCFKLKTLPRPVKFCGVFGILAALFDVNSYGVYVHPQAPRSEKREALLTSLLRCDSLSGCRDATAALTPFAALR